MFRVVVYPSTASMTPVNVTTVMPAPIRNLPIPQSIEEHPVSTTTPISPKVTTGGIWAGYATLLLALLNTVTPDSLAFLGHLAPLAYGVVIGGSYALGAYLKEDPLRKPEPATPTAADNLAALLTPAPAKTFPTAIIAATPTDTSTAAAAAPTVTPVYEPPAAPADPATPAE